MQQCVFCQIASKSMPSKVVYEDENALAFLDIAPRSTGMAIVIPKEHYKEFDENPELSAKVFDAAQIVAKMVKIALRPMTVDFSIIPSMEVSHFHIRIYPVYEKELPLIENKPMQTSEEELDEIAKKIKAVRIEKPEPKEEAKPEKKQHEKRRNKDEVYWIKKQIEIG